VLEYLLSKYEVLSSNPTTAKQKRVANEHKMLVPALGHHDCPIQSDYYYCCDYRLTLSWPLCVP
jgi:hypothetical protein